jgi:hypothetical protein
MLKVEDLIHTEYYETDTPELIITENGHIERISKAIIEHLKPYLKVSFTTKVQDELIGHIEEDYAVIEGLTAITDSLLSHMIDHIGNNAIDETAEVKPLNSLWHFKPGQQPRL